MLTYPAAEIIKLFETSYYPRSSTETQEGYYLVIKFVVFRGISVLYLFKLLSMVSDQNARGLSRYIIFDITVVFTTTKKSF